jgi:general secretion pathway protein H
MTLIEVIIVVVIIALAASGISLSLGAISRANLKSSAGKLGAAMRYAYNRAVTQGTTVRVSFSIPGNTFSIQEAREGVLLATKKEKEQKQALNEKGKVVDAIDPWEAAQARIAAPDKPTVGASPFAPLESEDGTPLKRYNKVKLPSGVQIIKLLVAHEPEPRTRGEGAVHFFPGGRGEHALVQIGDGREGIYTVEVSALTGRIRVYPREYEATDLLEPDDEDQKTTSEVKDQ